MVKAVYHVKRTLFIVSRTVRTIELSVDGPLANQRPLPARDPGKQMNRPVKRTVEPDAVIDVVGNHDIALRIEREMLRSIQERFAPITAVPAVALFPRAVDHGVDPAVRLYLAQGVAFPRGDEDTSVRPVAGRARSDQGGLGSNRSISRSPPRSITCHCPHNLFPQVDFTDPAITQIRQQEAVLRLIQRDGVDPVEASLISPSTISSKATLSSHPCKGRDLSLLYETHPMIEGIRNEEPSILRPGKVVHPVETASRGRPSVSLCHISKPASRPAVRPRYHTECPIRLEGEHPVPVFILHPVHDSPRIEDHREGLAQLTVPAHHLHSGGEDSSSEDKSGENGASAGRGIHYW